MSKLTSFDRESILKIGQVLAFDASRSLRRAQGNGDNPEKRFRVGKDLVSWHLVTVLAHFYLFAEKLCPEEKEDLLEIVAVSITFLQDPGIQSQGRLKFERLYDRANYAPKTAELRDEIAEIVQEKHPYLVDDMGVVIHDHPENLTLDNEIAALIHLKNYLLTDK